MRLDCSATHVLCFFYRALLPLSSSQSAKNSIVNETNLLRSGSDLCLLPICWKTKQSVFFSCTQQIGLMVHTKSNAMRTVWGRNWNGGSEKILLPYFKSRGIILRSALFSDGCRGNQLFYAPRMAFFPSGKSSGKLESVVNPIGIIRIIHGYPIATSLSGRGHIACGRESGVLLLHVTAFSARSCGGPASAERASL